MKQEFMKKGNGLKKLRQLETNVWGDRNHLQTARDNSDVSLDGDEEPGTSNNSLSSNTEAEEKSTNDAASD